jgi:hypothetical protein
LSIVLEGWLRIAGPEEIWVRLAIRTGIIVRIVANWVTVTILIEVTILRFSVRGNYGTKNDN